MTHHKLKLSSKVCLGCGRPFIWRKKWERDWEQVRFCSERCRRQGGSPQPDGERLKSGIRQR
ncbi:DUF2256 domain-containing protein [Sphingobium yanoikuyae]|uniref:DUF2256 domain-containing protein n=1 Tax=Sphingobium yanoikuyae TaxID=13690 RepID=UPI0022DD7983|nr:DUF2256 domain-containing protein [Sphingobium yanoikuyae]WBQ19137.1 DUF2256 domain-containing protein [Sphingobium yanoikuyae]